MMRSTLLIVALWGAVSMAAQIRLPETPKFSTFSPIGPSVPVPHQQPLHDGSVVPPSTAERNAALIAELRTGDALAPKNSRKYQGRYRFADPGLVVADPGHIQFGAAFNLLNDMLRGTRPLDLSVAVYATDLPATGKATRYSEFSDMLRKLTDMVRHRLASEGMDPEDPLAAHYGIQKLFTDTLIDPATGRAMPPLRYDLEDFHGDDDPAQLTVIKLLNTGEGQCRSLPLLYLLLAQRMKADAYWAFSPNHSYVKFHDRQGTFYNFEATNGHITTDAWVIGSGFVKAYAIKNRIYADTLGTRQVVAHLLVDLALAYEQRYGYDEAFIGACLDIALDEFPNGIHAWLLLSNLRTAGFDRAAYEAGYPPLDDLATAAPSLHKQLQELKQLYAYVDALGFAEMPADAYAAWLRSLDAEKQKREEEELKKPLLREL